MLNYKVAQSCLKSNDSSSCMTIDVFKTAQKVKIHLGYLCLKNCHQELTKIAKSGHTGWHLPAQLVIVVVPGGAQSL